MWAKAISIALVISILGALGVLGYILATPRAGEGLTEFYILGTEGKAADYPRELVVGEEAKVTVIIVNRERETMSYWVKVRIDGVRDNQTGPLELGHDEEWEEIVSFTPDRVGDTQKVEFLLYKDMESEPYLKLHLWIDVKE